jgi:CP family cyanate transporter-like MFS transporter
VIVAVGANLRIGLVSIAPLLEDIRSSLAMSRPVAGLVIMIPLLALAAFSVVGGRWAAGFGPRPVLLSALTVLALALVARAFAPTAALLLAATLPVGVALALAGASLPVLIKDRFPASAGAVTGAYVTALDIGAGVAALTAVPLAHALGGWRAALALTAVPAVAALPLIARLEKGTSARARREAKPLTASPISGRSLGLLAGIFAAQSFCFVGVITWVAAAYQASGWSPAAAGVASGFVLLGAVPTALAVPLLSDRVDRRRLVVPVAAATAIGVAGMAGWPTFAPFLWLTLFAVGTGALFPLALTLPLDVAPDPRQAGRLAGVALGIGYGVSAFAAVFVGALHDASGGFTLPFALLAASAALAAPLALSLPDRPTRARTQHAAHCESASAPR